MVDFAVILAPTLQNDNLVAAKDAQAPEAIVHDVVLLSAMLFGH